MTLFDFIGITIGCMMLQGGFSFAMVFTGIYGRLVERHGFETNRACRYLSAGVACQVISLVGLRILIYFGVF